MSSVTSICPSQCLDAPIPIVGTETLLVIFFAKLSKTHSITMANTPLSNATTFGTLTSGSYQMANGLISNGTRVVFGIGGGTSSGGYNNIIEYITIATTGNSTDFGNLTEGRAGQGQSSSATRGLLAGGKYTSGASSVRATIDYITIDTTANAGDFGDLTQARSSLSGLSDTGALRE